MRRVGCQPCSAMNQGRAEGLSYDPLKVYPLILDYQRDYLLSVNAIVQSKEGQL